MDENTEKEMEKMAEDNKLAKVCKKELLKLGTRSTLKKVDPQLVLFGDNLVKVEDEEKEVSLQFVDLHLYFSEGSS